MGKNMTIPDEDKVYYASILWAGADEVLENWFDVVGCLLEEAAPYPASLYYKFFELKKITLDSDNENTTLLMAGEDAGSLLEITQSDQCNKEISGDSPHLHFEPVPEEQWEGVLESARFLKIEEDPIEARSVDSEGKEFSFTGISIRLVATGPRDEYIMSWGTLQEDYGNLVFAAGESNSLIGMIFRARGLENIEIVDNWLNYIDVEKPPARKPITYENDMSENRVYFRQISDYEWHMFYWWAYNNDLLNDEEEQRNLEWIAKRASGNIKVLTDLVHGLGWKETIRPESVDLAVNLHKLALTMGFEVSAEDKSKMH